MKSDQIDWNERSLELKHIHNSDNCCDIDEEEKKEQPKKKERKK